MDQQEGKIDENVRDAIKCRLIFRRNFLIALDQDVDVVQTRSTENFASCLSQLSQLTQSTSLGKAIPEAFSLKIQRKLASTVPPRPMVNISSEDALAHLRRLCQDAIDLKEILEYRGPSNFKVWSSTSLFCLSPVPNFSRSLSGHCCLENPSLRFISDPLPRP